MRKYIIGVAAVLLAVVASSFTTIAKHTPLKGAFSTTWYYNGDADHILDASAYSQTTMPTDCQPSGTRPCSISVDANNQTDLQTFLDGEDDAAEVTALSPSKRP